MTTQLREAIARLRWSPPTSNDRDIDLICDALEGYLDGPFNKPKFDKVAYQREYMRKHRALAKAMGMPLKDLQALRKRPIVLHRPFPKDDEA